ncbi:MAG: hypothetical protein K2X38_04410 [Gemmataceae bacterium]|nr:hypothetical protein [Gemmataceae bacterium]
MNEQIPQQQAAEFIWRRFQDVPGAWITLVPVAFALMVIGLMVLLRREHRFRGLLIPTIVVVVLGAAYLLAGRAFFLRLFSWWYVLVPMLGIGLFYVGMMYFKDAKSIHPGWASFLGILRCAVYAILAVVFLLPGCQNFEVTEYPAKTLFLFDVSGSMATKDDVPAPGQDPSTILSRQEKVIQALTSTEGPNGAKKTAFLDRFTQKAPIWGYRFGPFLDESDIRAIAESRPMKGEDLTPWLLLDKTKAPLPANLEEGKKEEAIAKIADHYEALKSRTNIGGSVLQALKVESNSYLQAVVLIGDGQSNLGSDEAVRELLTRVNNRRQPVPLFTVGVGAYRQPAEIRIDDLQAPELVRPDDKFPIRVPIVGAGLDNEEVEVTLEATRVKDISGQPTKGEQTFVLPAKRGKFQGAGEYPQDTVEFEIDVQELKKIKAADDAEGVLEGTWRFVAKTPRHAREAFAKPFHVSDPPTDVVLQKKKLRVLLFAGTPSHEYQFVRTALNREANEKRLELSVYLQSGKEDNVEQEVEAERLLPRFPNRVGPNDPSEKHLSLTDYDVIISFDADWTALDSATLKTVKDWVSNYAGGIVFVAGPVHTFHLARPAGADISSILSIFPVILTDSRLHGLGIGHDASRPYTLDFSGAAKMFDFLKLDEAGDSPTAGWDTFFWGKSGKAEGADARPLRGFFSYYPVSKLKPDSQVIATFNGPTASRINDGRDPQPYMVGMRVGSGKTVYIGSAETWRLRQFKDGFHERFWIKLSRYASAGATQQKKYGRILIARNEVAGRSVAFEAQIKGPDLLPLNKDFKPTVIVKRLDKEGEGLKPQSFDIKAKATSADWQGWFQSNSFRPKEPGEYEYRIQVPGTTEVLTARQTVRRPNPELDNVRNNFDFLHLIASDAEPTLKSLDPAVRKDILKVLQPASASEQNNASTQPARLFFRLDQIETILQCLDKVQPRRESIKGRPEDLWDSGFKPDWNVSSFHLAWIFPLALGLLGFAILWFLSQPVGGSLFLAGFGIVSVAVVMSHLLFGIDWPIIPVHFAHIVVVVTLLLGAEWLTRKLLKLA